MGTYVVFDKHSSGRSYFAWIDQTGNFGWAGADRSRAARLSKPEACAAAARVEAEIIRRGYGADLGKIVVQPATGGAFVDWRSFQRRAAQ